MLKILEPHIEAQVDGRKGTKTDEGGPSSSTTFRYTENSNKNKTRIWSEGSLFVLSNSSMQSWALHNWNRIHQALQTMPQRQCWIAWCKWVHFRATHTQFQPCFLNRHHHCSHNQAHLPSHTITTEISIVEYEQLSTVCWFVASQMWCFGRLLPMMVSKRVPIEDSHWESRPLMMTTKGWLHVCNSHVTWNYKVPHAARFKNIIKYLGCASLKTNHPKNALYDPHSRLYGKVRRRRK